MKRFMGLMPSSCIEISKDFKDENGRIIHIDAGPEGWTVMYPDGSTEYEDRVASSKVNYTRAYEAASKESTLTSIETKSEELCESAE